jgi:hypothetical protein
MRNHRIHIIQICFVVFLMACGQKPEEFAASSYSDKQTVQVLRDTTDVMLRNHDTITKSLKSTKYTGRPAEVAEADMAITYKDDLIPAVKNNFYSCADNLCAFESDVQHAYRRSVGCSEGRTQFSFNAKTDGDKFSCHGEECNLFEFKYDYSGGLYGKSVNRIESGYILGDRLTDGSWKVKVDVVVRITDIFMESGSERIQLEEVFLPR